MPYREYHFSLYQDGSGPYNLIHEVSEEHGETVRATVVNVDNPGFAVFGTREQFGTVKRLGPDVIGRVQYELERGEREFAFLEVSTDKSDDVNGVKKMISGATAYHVRVTRIESGLTESERAEAFYTRPGEPVKFDGTVDISEPKDDQKDAATIADKAFRALYPEDAAKVDESRRGRRAVGSHRLMRFFTTEHLPENLRPIGNIFVEVAEGIDKVVPSGSDQTWALMKLIEAKDAAVRAMIVPKY